MSSLSIKENNLIEKLDNKNYTLWKFKVEMLLIKEDLFNVISDDPPNPITTEWRSKDRKARAMINLLIADDQIIHVKALNTAKETWEALRAIHERSNLSSKLFLLRKLYSIKLNEDGDMQEHITNIFQARDKLTAIGEEISDQHITALLLCSLPKSYDTLITALEARTETELTIEFVRNKLIDEYNKRVERSQNPNNSTESAYKVNKRHEKPRNNNNPFCTNCKKASHNLDECWFLKNKTKRNPPPSNSRGRQSYPKNKSKNSYCFTASEKEISEEGKLGQIEASLLSLDEDQMQAEREIQTRAKSDTVFIIDSGSSTHISNEKQNFISLRENKNTCITIADGTKLKSAGEGDMIFTHGKEEIIKLKNVLYVPQIQSNLLSIKKVTESGCQVVFKNDECLIKNNGKIILQGKAQNNLYEINLKPMQKHETANFVNQCNNPNCIITWHKRLGHKNISQLNDLISNNLAIGIKINKCRHDLVCENCIISKLSDAPYPKMAEYRANDNLELIHSDLCGPFNTATVSGYRYFLTFIDDYSRYTTLYLLKNKSETFDKFKEFLALTQNKFGKKIKALRSDNGGEYTSNEFENYLKEQGIQHQLIVPNSPPQNGVSERKNRTIVEMTRSLLNEAKLPHIFWGEAVNTAVYLQNRIPTKSHNKTPYELWNGRKPNLSHIKTFGCKAFAYIDKTKRKKLDNKAIEGIFMGYDNRRKAYRILTHNKNIIISRSAKFIENKYPGHKFNDDSSEHENKSTAKLELRLLEEEKPEEEDTSPPQSVAQTGLRRSERTNKGVPPDRFAFVTKNEIIKEPKDWNDVINIENPIERKKWLEAADEEIKSLKENDTWELVDPPTNRKIIGCKWTFKIKYNSEGKIQKYKARLVAKGYCQKYGIDYDETFAPVISHTAIRAFINMAVYKNLKMRHVDIKTAFLNGTLDEEIYMEQPQGYEEKNKENKVCKLKKSIYGLKQSARAWHIKLEKTLKEMGFEQSNTEKCLYKLKDENRKIYIIIYVDDLLIAGKEQDINEIIEKLKNEYQITDLGEATNYLGIQINRDDQGNISLSQINKIEQLVENFKLTEAKPTNTPMDPGFIKQNDNEKLLPNNTNYRKAIGALLYIATITRPDIATAVNILSRRNENPREKDWEAVKRVIRYLKTTKKLKLIINKDEEPILKAYADADWATDQENRRSTTGNLFKLGKNAIHWTSKKQNCISLSSAEAEYIAASTASQDILWLTKLLKDLDLTQEMPIKLYEDNQSAIKLTNSEKNNARTKHIDVKVHYIRELCEKNIIKLEYLQSKEMTADILTKALPKPIFIKHRDNLNLLDRVDG